LILKCQRHKSIYLKITINFDCGRYRRLDELVACSE
jgi:hypothetical protein